MKSSFRICPRCKISKPLSDYSPGNYRCRPCKAAQKREHAHQNGINIPMEQNKTCSAYLGIHIAERILSHYFENVSRTPYGTPGYDFTCKNGYKIDVKCACIQKIKNKSNCKWQFSIQYNTIADYFLCLGFDNRDSLEPQHIWLIPGNVVNKLDAFQIPVSEYGLSKWHQYEKPLDKVLQCCATLREL
jgi:hypothetical protein